MSVYSAVQSPRAVALVLTLSVVMGLSHSAHACGPDFPLELLQDRKQSLRGMVSGNFAFESARLVPKSTGSYPSGPDASWWELSPEQPVPDEQKAIETQGYSEVQIQQWLTARNANNAAQTFELAAGLPEAHRHYLAGAKAFAMGDDAQATEHFQAALDDRAVWSAFMLGRIAKRSNDLAQMSAQFARVRELSNVKNPDPLPDPLGLALASFGEEAQVHWWNAQDPSLDPTQRQNAMHQAVAGYANQAAYGSNSGSASLLILARAINDDPQLSDVVLGDPLVQKLVIIYLFSRGFEAKQRNTEEEFWPYSETEYRTPDLAAGMEPYFIKAPLLERLMSRVESSGNADIGFDRLAAALYRAGDFTAAEKFANANESALSHWVRAKLALRAGDGKKAAASYSQALKHSAASHSTEEEWVPLHEYLLGNQRCRIEAEAGTLALNNADVASALQAFFNAGREYYTDMAYIAERLMPTDELLDFVRSQTKPQTATVTEWGETTFIRFDEQGRVLPGYEHAVLRGVTARRLMRESRFAEALELFDDPKVKQVASDYKTALEAAQKQDAIAKAQSLFKAATLARQNGLEFLGFEGSPDYYSQGANYGGEFGIPTPAADPAQQRANLLSESEIKLLQSSVAKPDLRLHYRYRATELAQLAADSVPARSQAFAAMLCQATSWLIYRDQPAGEAIYRRYLKQGAFVPWGGAFGTNACPSPDFSRAQALLDEQTQIARKRMLKQYLPWIAAGLALLAALGIGMAIARRKKASTRNFH